MARKRVPSPPWSNVHGFLHLKLNEAAAVLGISTTHLKFLCRKNGLPRWPGKTVRMRGWIRSLNTKLEKLTMEATRHGPFPLPGETKRRNRRTLTKIREEFKEVMDRLVRVHTQVRRPAPEQQEQGGDGTVNLLDKVGVPHRGDANGY